jgi:UDP-GlcNAc:undecaprenyl-phosphate GlcNAc-1-phosphate transferase
MGITNQEYFYLFLASFVLVGFLTPLMRRIAIAKNVVDRPNSAHKSHKKSVPYLGGIAIIVGIVAITYGSSLISEFTQNTFWLATSVLVPAVILGLIGLIDDLNNLSPWPRFVAQSVAAIFTSVLLITTDNFGNPTGSRIFDVVITTLWIVGICNAINFFDNLDGGAAGTVAVTALGLAFISIHSNQYLITAMSVVTLGSLLGFLIWNKNPARIYMGDAGALFLGILISVLTIRLKPLTNTTLGAYATPILLLAVPIMDTSVAVISRLKRNISPFQGGMDHLSHRLIRLGLTRKITAIILWILSIIFCGLSLSITFLNYSEKQILICAATIWFVLFIFFLKQKDD